MLRNFVLGALKARSRLVFFPAVFAEPATPTREVVEPESRVLEGVGLPGQVRLHVGGERELDPVEVGNAGEGDAHRIGIGLGLDGDEVAAEVAGERLIVADHGRLELRLAVVEIDRGVVDLEPPQADRHRLRGSGLRRRLGGLLRDVPVRGAVLERDQPEPGLVELDGAHDDRPAGRDVPQHAEQVQCHPQVPDRGERIALEPVLADGGQVVEREREVGKVPEEAEADVLPIDARLEVAVHLGLHPLRDPVAKQQREHEQQGQHEQDQRPDDGQDARGSFHESPFPGSSHIV